MNRWRGTKSGLLIGGLRLTLMDDYLVIDFEGAAVNNPAERSPTATHCLFQTGAHGFDVLAGSAVAHDFK